ncbi:MAG TPA: AzlC family ABC transporter permease [Frankiaceae bacterium]
MSASVPFVPPVDTPVPRPERRAVLRDAWAVGLATGSSGLSFGALSVTSGLSVLQTCLLSLLLFSGGSQFALVAVVGAGGNPLAGAASAVLLGLRNGLYGLGLSRLLRVRGLRRVVAAQLVIDESTAMATGQPTPERGRLAFHATGIAVFVCWNVATLAAASAARALASPQALGLDVVAPAAFLALLGPRIRDRATAGTALLAGAVALAAAPLVPAGVPVLLAAAVGALLVLARR